MKYNIYDKEVPDPNAQQFIDESNGAYQGCSNFSYDCIYIYVCVCVCVCVCIYIYMCLCVYVYIYIYIYCV